MTVVMRPFIYKGRIFSEGQSYGDPYVGVFLVVWEGPDVVEIDLTHGEMSRADILEIYTQVRDLGAKTLRAWRADNHRLTGGKAVRTEGRFTLWESDVERTIKLLSRAKK